MSEWNAARLALIGQHFDALVELDAAAREAVLATLAGDPELVRELRAMLAADGQDLDLPAAVAAKAAEVTEWVNQDVPRDADGRRQYGPWTVLRELGRGGMGVVYEVEREVDGLRQRAALKRILGGLDHAAVALRFRQERAVLLRLQHRHIARFLDAGAEVDGTPWLALEYIDGMPLLDHVRESGASLAQRLELFDAICAAVAYAHRQLVVHRDLKPANVLVDREGQVRLLDFGIAKLLGDADAGATQERAPLTPRYASPEQRRGGPVSTATDVYSLGIVLFELLTLRHPFPEDQTVPIHDPPAPSQTAAPGLPQACSARELRGDLDAIVMKAMAEDPAQRYASVDALREDLERHRARLPVRARPYDWRYRSARFIARHRLGVTLASVAGAAIAISVALAWWQADRATAAAARASAVQDFLLQLFEMADPDVQAGGHRLTAHEIAAGAMARLPALEAREPRLGIDLRLLLARVRHQLGEHDAALAMLDGLPALPEAQLGQAAALLRAQALIDSGAGAEAEAVLRDLSTDPGLDAATKAQVAVLHSEALRTQTELAKAETAAQLALKLTQALPDRPLLHAEAQTALAGALWQQSRADEALPLIEAAAAAYRDARAEHHLAAIKLETNLCILYRDLRQFERATTQCDTAVSVAERYLPRLHMAVLMALGARAGLYHQSSDYQRAIELMRESLARTREARAATDPLVEATLYSLAAIEQDAGQDAAALAHYREAWQLNQERAPGANPRALRTLGSIASMEARMGQDTAAIETIDRALSMARELRLDGSPDYARSLDTKAALLRRQGELEQALKLHAEAAALLAVGRHPPLRLVRHHLGHAESLAAAGQTDAALAQIAKAEILVGGEHPDPAAQATVAEIRRKIEAAAR